MVIYSDSSNGERNDADLKNDCPIPYYSKTRLENPLMKGGNNRGLILVVAGKKPIRAWSVRFLILLACLCQVVSVRLPSRRYHISYRNQVRALSTEKPTMLITRSLHYKFVR